MQRQWAILVGDRRKAEAIARFLKVWFNESHEVVIANKHVCDRGSCKKPYAHEGNCGS